MLLIAFSMQFALQVYSANGDVDTYSINQLHRTKLENFETIRDKDGSSFTEQWQGINLINWLTERQYTEFHSLRLESSDNYMVRINRAELDSMPGFIALKRDGKWLDSTQVRIIFPRQREMFWIRGLSSIFLEDFKPVPPPKQLFIWDALKSELVLKTGQEPLVNVSGYLLDDVMRQIFHAEEGSVVLVARDGLKNRLDYPKHLKSALFEVTEDGTLNLISHILPAGMWLKDIVYMQCGPYGIIKYDFLYLLPTLYKTLDWKGLNSTDHIIKASVRKEKVPLESLYQPDAIPFTADDWIELP